jgi:diguanylate cyclase (GGDEF)-like protein/PAS domain S-box-containing protein
MPDSGAFAPWNGDPAQGLAIANLLRRVAGLAAVHVYELEVTHEGGYRCRLWVGDAVERLVGDIPPGMTAEDAWEACVHPDDRAGYDESFRRQCHGEATDVEYRMLGFDGVERWLWERCLPHQDEAGRLLVDGIVTDVTERRRIQEQLAEAAYRDSLTGLHNRRWFERCLDQRISGARRDRSALAILFIDLDGFKTVNDQHGHAFGDELLVCVARRIESLAWDLPVARLGGDEFLVLYDRASLGLAAEPAEVLADRIQSGLTRPYCIREADIVIGASIGVATLPPNGCTGAELQQAADQAMYQEKLRKRRAA